MLLRYANQNKNSERSVVDWYIYGAGGHGAETMEVLRHMLQADGRTNFVLKFIDDFSKNKVIGFPVVGIWDAIPRSLVSRRWRSNLRAKLLIKATKAKLGQPRLYHHLHLCQNMLLLKTDAL